MPRLLIAIVDTLANEIVGPIQLFPHQAPAIRMFGDVLADDRTAPAQHPDDHQLVMLGTVDESMTILPQREVLLTGAQWRLMSQTRNNANPENIQ